MREMGVAVAVIEDFIRIQFEFEEIRKYFEEIFGIS